MNRLLFLFGIIALQGRGFSQPPAFEVASVKHLDSGITGTTSISPYGKGTFTASYASLELLVCMAYGVADSQLVNAPKWLESEYYEITAKPEAGVLLSRAELMPRLQRLLEERLALKTHQDSKDITGYALVVAKGGPKLQPSTDKTTGGQILPGGMRIPNTTMDGLAAMLARPLGSPVVNKTGIRGDFTINLKYAKSDAVDSSLPSIFTAVQEQLGLRLEKQKVSQALLVIDRVEKVPTGN